MGVQDSRILLTTRTSRGPSSRLTQFLKELRLVFPNSQRINRGHAVSKEIIEAARSNDFSNIVIVHEHRGEPDGLIVSHLPYGPTAYFGLGNVGLRHDLSSKLGTMSEAAPHLVFDNFSTGLGERVAQVLKALFPVPKEESRRVMTFANREDIISFRHHPPNYYPSTCSGNEPLTKSGWWTNVFQIICSPNTQNIQWVQEQAALNKVQVLGPAMAPLATRPIGTSGTYPARTGECLLGDKDGRSCQCHGTRTVSGNQLPNWEFGSFGGSYCEVQSCPIPAHDTSSTKDPVLARIISAGAAFNVTITPELMAKPNFFPGHSITYNGTASPNYWSSVRDTLPDASISTWHRYHSMPTSMTYECRDGFMFAPGSLPTIRCDLRLEQRNATGHLVGYQGDYSTRNTTLWPRCIPAYCPAVVDAQLSPSVRFRYPDENTYASAPPVGSLVVFTCAPGYATTATAAEMTRNCSDSHAWSDLTGSAAAFPTCEPNTCRQLLEGHDQNGGVFSPAAEGASLDPEGMGAVFGTVATLSCPAGFYSQANFTVCEPSGFWTGLLPTQEGGVAPVSCQPVTCTWTALPEHTVASSLVATYPDSIAFSCEEGYDLSGAASVQCGAGAANSPVGAWSAGVPVCVAKPCQSALTAPQNGFVSLDGGAASTGPVAPGTIFSVAHFSCAAGFELLGSSSDNCAAGTWSTTTSGGPTCRALPCATLQLGRGQLSDRTEGVTGAVATLSCQAGFDQQGPAALQCGPDGTWGPSDPAAAGPSVCTPKSCGAFDSSTLPGVLLSASSGSFGDSIVFSCAAGYTLVGPRSVSCLRNGADEVAWTALSSQPNQRPQCWQSFVVSGAASSVPVGSTLTFSVGPSVAVASAVHLAVSVVSSVAGHGATITPALLSFGPGETESAPQQVELVVAAGSSPALLSVQWTVVTNTIPALAAPPSLALLSYTGSTAPLGRCALQSGALVPGAGFGGQGSADTDGIDSSATGGDRFGFVSASAEECAAACSALFPCAQALYQRSTSQCFLQRAPSAAAPAQPSEDFDSATCIRACAPFALSLESDPRVLVSSPTFDAALAPFPAQGQQAAFSCAEGYMLQGPPSSTCTAEGWDAVAPSCAPTPCAELHVQEPLRSTATTGVQGDVVSFSCAPGYAFASGSASSSLRCGPGVASAAQFWWSDPAQAGSGLAGDAALPSCAAQACQPAIAVPAHGVQRGSGTTNSTLFFSCEAGYVAVGGVDSLACTPQGWAAPGAENAAPACLRQCGLATAPAHGVLLAPGAGSYLEGQVVSAQCDAGFGAPTGALVQSATCQADGSYSAVFLCSPLPCPAFVASDPRLIVSGADAQAVTGSSLSFSCPGGFDLRGANGTTCLADASSTTASAWSNATSAGCVARPCAPLTPPQHGSLSSLFGATGAVVTLSCEAGYVASAPSTTCQADGSWSEPPLDCVAQRCAPDFTAPLNGSASALGGSTGHSVSFTCTPGWIMEGAETSVCLPSGSWSSPAPLCRVGSCPNLDAVPNSLPHAHSGVTGDVVAYACESGYNMYGNATNVCMPSGQWANEQPYCRRVACPAPTAPVHGSVYPAAGALFGDQAVYACSFGFALSGAAGGSGNNNVTTCSADGSWSVATPTCTDLCETVQCGPHGSCAAGACTCSGGYTGAQCTVEPETFSWVLGSFGACSVTCASGVQTRTVQCVSSRTNQPVPDSSCTASSAGAKPASTQVCSLAACPVTAVSCPAGFYCPSKWKMVMCPRGSYCPKNSASPTLCPAGYFCPGRLMSFPLRCPPGHTCKNPGMILPIYCRGGRFCPGGNGGWSKHDDHDEDSGSGSGNNGNNGNSGNNGNNGNGNSGSGNNGNGNGNGGSKGKTSRTGITTIRANANEAVEPVEQLEPVAETEVAVEIDVDLDAQPASDADIAAASAEALAAAEAAEVVDADPEDPTLDAAEDEARNGTPCADGSFCPTGSVEPTTCPKGHVCAGRAAAPTRCMDEGSYCPAGAAKPLPCPAGYTCPAPLLSPSGEFVVADPQPCPAGMVSSPGSLQCQQPCSSFWREPASVDDQARCSAWTSSAVAIFAVCGVLGALGVVFAVALWLRARAALSNRVQRIQPNVGVTGVAGELDPKQLAVSPRKLSMHHATRSEASLVAQELGGIPEFCPEGGFAVVEKQ